MPGIHLISAWLAGLRVRFADCRGAVAVIFGLSVVPLAMVVGLATDYSFYVKVQSQLNLAADTAAMQAVRVASEVNGSNMTLVQYQAAVQAAGQQAGQQWFQAQMGNLVNGSVPASNIAINVSYNPNGSRFTSNVSYTGTVPTNFGALFRVASLNIGGVATAVISNSYVEVLMLLDTSSSMLIPSTSADIARLEGVTPCSTIGIDGGHQMIDWYNWDYFGNYGYAYFSNANAVPPPLAPVNGNCDASFTGDPAACTYAPAMANVSPANAWLCTNNGGYPYRSGSQTYYLAQAPCAFACHSSTSNNDFYGLAKSLNPPIQLRLDVVQSAAANVITALQAKEVETDQFSVGVYAFNANMSAVWPSSGEATSDLATAQSKTQNLPTPVTPPSNVGNTDFPTSIKALNQNVSAAGDGTTPATPLKNLFIVTDGINDLPVANATPGLMTSATNEQLCALFWAKGFNVYVLYTPYLPLPNQKYQGQVAQYVEPTANSANVAALKACARYPANFYVASDPAAINTAMQTMLAAALNSPGRVSN